MDVYICKKCGISKLLTEEYFRKSSYTLKDGSIKYSFMTTCLHCHNIYQKNKYHENKSKSELIIDENFRTCKICNILKPFLEFRRTKKKYKKSTKELYYHSTCKECCKDKKSKQDKKYNDTHKLEKTIRDKKYREEHKEKIAQNKKQYYLVNKDILIEKNNKYHKSRMKNDPIYRKEYRRQSRKRSKKYYDIRNKRRNKQRKENPSLRLRSIISKSIWQYLKNNNGSKNGKSCMAYLPYTIQQLKTHLEKNLNHG